MTSVQPPSRMPFAAAGVSTPVQTLAQCIDIDFASLLPPDELDKDRGLAAPPRGESRQFDLEAGLAHVFNAFGFFQAGPQTDVSMPRNAAGAPALGDETLSERGTHAPRHASAPNMPES